MKSKIKYIELSTDYSHNGPAWIGLVTFSKSGRTIYFNGKAFQRIGSDRTSGNFYDIETGDEYWISGVKKDMKDRHKFGSGKIFVETRVLSEYLQIIDKSELPKNEYEIIKVEINKATSRISELENEKLEPSEFGANLHFKKQNELTNNEIKFLITELHEDEKYAKYNKGRRFIKKKRMELEKELEKREIKNIG